MADRGKGFAFVLEGETEKEFYMAFLQYLCKKHSTEMIRIAYESVPDIVYQIDTETGAVLIKFHVVCSITQMPRLQIGLRRNAYINIVRIRGMCFSVTIKMIIVQGSANSMRETGRI